MAISEITDPKTGTTISVTDDTPTFVNINPKDPFKTTTFGDSSISDGEVTDDFENWGGLAKILQYIAAGFNPFGPQGSSNPEYRTLEAYLRQIFGPLPEGAVDYAADDLNGDGVNELYAVDADGNPLTVYGYDSDGNTESSEFNQWQYDSFLNEIENVETDEDFLDIVNRYESAGIQNNSVVMSMTGPIKTSGEDILKEVFGESGATIGAGVTITVEDLGAILTGQVSFEDFVRDIFILTKGILNLPIPDWLPLPAVFKLPTIGEIWDKTFGGIIGDVQDSKCIDKENAVAECAGEIGDAVVGAVGDFGKTVEGKVTDVYCSTFGCPDTEGQPDEGVLQNPEEGIQQVYDWITGIFGEDPKNMPPWIWGVVLGGVFGKEILGGLEDIFGDDVNDDGTIGVPPVTGDDFDCSSVGRIQQPGAKTEAECGGCAEGYEPKNGQCEAELDPCPGQQTRNEITNECEDPDPGFVPNDPCKTESGDSGKYDVDGNCVATVDPPPPVDCTQPKPGYTPSFNPADNAAHFEWEEACGATHCPDGSEKPASGICGEQPTCANGAVNAPDCNDCGDNTSPDMHEGGDCSKPLIQQGCANGATLESGCEKCPEGQDFNAAGVCVSKGGPGGITCDDDYPVGTLTFALQDQQKWWKANCDDGGGGGTEVCDNGATLESDCLECPEGQEFNAENKCVTTTTGTPPGSLGFSPDCNKPRPVGTVTFDLIEQQRAWDLECGGGGGGSFNCTTLNRSTNEDGSCGECLPGYVFDQNMDNCVKQEIPVTPTPPTTETPESASASVGGSAGGAFSPFMAGISYTPQPVPEVIQQPAGMFTGAQPRSNTKAVEQSIVKTLLPEYFA